MAIHVLIFGLFHWVLELQGLTAPNGYTYETPRFTQVDSGTAFISLPLPSEFCDGSMTWNENDMLKLDVSQYLGSESITLEIPLDWWTEQAVASHVKCVNATTTPELFLGFPLFHIYYIVYETDTGVLTFVPKQPTPADSSGTLSSLMMAWSGIIIQMLVVSLII